MKSNIKVKHIKQPSAYKKPPAIKNNESLCHLAFYNSLQANIISTVDTGKIIVANKAACKLLNYSKKELLTKSRADIFDINESSFKKMLKQRTIEGQSAALVTGIRKRGKLLACEITSAVFIGGSGIENAITTIADMSQSILKQKEIDTKKQKIVAHNIDLAISKQKNIDIKNDKIVADDIILARSKQKDIDTKKEKIVTENIITALAKSEARDIENNKWRKHIGKKLYDVMWDWNIATGQIYVSDSIEEVFGYKAQNNIINFTNFILCLLPKEKDVVEKKLLKTLASGKKSWNDSFVFKRHDGSEATTICRASIVRDEQGKAIHLIGAIQDVSKLMELEKKLDEQAIIQEEDRKTFLQLSKLSFDVIWDWNMISNKVSRGEGFEEMLGYPMKDYKGNISDWSDHIHPDDKEAVEKGLQQAIASSAVHWEQVFRFIRFDGTIAKVFDRASIIRNDFGKACRMIGVMQDLSRQYELEEKLKNEIAAKEKLIRENEKNFKLIFNSSSDILFDIDLVANKVVLSDAYEKEFGYKIINNITSKEDVFSHIHPCDKEALVQDYSRMLASVDTEWKYKFRFLRADDSVANLLSSGIVLRDADGKALRRIGHLEDISKQKVLEERLEQEIKLKEKQIAEAAEEAREIERSDLGKELHDNVNQLLSASRLYLNMAKQGGKNSGIYLSRSSEYTLTAIEEIRKLSKKLTTDLIKNIGLCESIDNLFRDTMEVNPIKIFFALGNFIEHSVNDKFKKDIFRIVQEQLNNILKHAKATEVAISLSQNKKSFILSILDNGVGFDAHKKQKGIGVANIKSRAESYNGTADFISKPGQGCGLVATFPVTDAVLNTFTDALLNKS